MITTNFDSHEIQIGFTQNTYFNQHQNGDWRGRERALCQLVNKTGQKQCFFAFYCEILINYSPIYIALDASPVPCSSNGKSKNNNNNNKTDVKK